MPLPLYLAMTGPELSGADPALKHLAYMACHFSPYSTGLSNFPQYLAPGSVLILNDSTPPGAHDPQLISDQLEEVSQKLQCCCIILDFQRPENETTHRICQAIVSTVSCPVAVSDKYAERLNGPVFLSAPPLYLPLSQWLNPWKNRQIWLEAALETQIITLDETGSRIAPVLLGNPPVLPHCSEKLHCHYKIEIAPNQVQFTLHRTREDLKELLHQAENLGVTAAVGLYQELDLPV